MPFDSGPITFTICHLRQKLGDQALERFAAYAAQPLKGVAEEPQVGWVSWRHLLETRIDDTTAYLGGYLYLNLRTAVRKIPASLLKAQIRMEELAWMQGNNVNYISSKQRKTIRQDVTASLLRDMPPSITGISMVYDAPHDLLYLGATSPTQIDAFMSRFYASHKFEPTALDAAQFCEVLLDRVTDGLPILDFTDNADRGAGEPTLGRDFLTWMWYFQEEHGGMINVKGLGDFGFALGDPFLFAAGEDSGIATQESLVRKGQVSASAEAKAAMMVGKKLRRAQITMARDRQVWTFVFDADTFTFRGMKLPDGEEMDPGSAFQERILCLTIFRLAFTALFEKFLQLIENDAALNKEMPRIRKWVQDLEGK